MVYAKGRGALQAHPRYTGSKQGPTVVYEWIDCMGPRKVWAFRLGNPIRFGRRMISRLTCAEK